MFVTSCQFTLPYIPDIFNTFKTFSDLHGFTEDYTFFTSYQRTTGFNSLVTAGLEKLRIQTLKGMSNAALHYKID